MLLIALLVLGSAQADDFKSDPSPNPPPKALPDLFGTSSVPKGCRGTENEPYLDDPSVLGCRVPFKPGPNFAESMMEYFKASGVRKVSSLVACLPEEFRKNFILAKDSSSLQKTCSNAANPRLILFSADGKQMIGIPGMPDQPGCDNIEVVEYNRDQAKFVPSLIEFSKPNVPPSKLPAFAHGADTSCENCHHGREGEEWVPKWTSYPTWPGFYGQMDDTFGKGLDGRSLGNDDEKAQYLAFSKDAFADAKGEGGREPYKYLMRPQLKDPEQQKFSPFQTDANAGDSFALRPNTRFNAAIIRANAERIAARYRDAPGSVAKKYEAAAMLLGCPVYGGRKSGLKAEAKALAPKLKEEADRLYNRYLCREKKICGGKAVFTCDSNVSDLSGKTAGKFCPGNEEDADVPATLNFISKDLGLSEREAKSLFLQDVTDYGAEPNYQSMTLGIGGGMDLGKSLTGVALLKELAKNKASGLDVYMTKGPENPVCTHKDPGAKPTKQPRCVAPETCEVPPLNFVPKQGDPAICEKLRQLAAVSGPKGVVSPGGTGTDAGGAK